MAPRKAMPPPSPSSSGSGSESGSSSDASSSDEEQQQRQQQKQKQKETAQAKVSSTPPRKKAVVPKRKRLSPALEEEQQQKTKTPQQAAPPSPLKKKPVLNKNKKPPNPVSRSAAIPAAAADDDSSSEEEGSDSPPKAKSAKLTPPPSRLLGNDLSSSVEHISSPKTEGRLSALAAQQLGKGKGKKRKGEQQEVGDAQEGDGAAASGQTAKKYFQRLWRVEDEVALLQGLLDFQAKDDGTHAISDANTLLEFIHGSVALQGKFSKSQIYEKIRRLRRKYQIMLRKWQNGVDPSFAQPQEQVAFELSKKVWPTIEDDIKNHTGTEAKHKRGNGTEAKQKSGTKGRERAALLYPMLIEAMSLLQEGGNNLPTGSVSRAFESLRPRKAKTLEDRWNKHFVAGAKYFLERARLKKDLLESLAKVLPSD